MPKFPDRHDATVADDAIVGHVKFFVGQTERDAINNAMKCLGLSQGDVMRLFVKIGASMVPILEAAMLDEVRPAHRSAFDGTLDD